MGNSKIKKYIPEIVIFGFIFAILMVDLTPDFTFMNKSLDSIEFTFGAKYFYTTHQMSVPLYLLLGHLFLMIPFGTDAWRMGLISVLSSMGTCVFIYFIIRRTLRIYPHVRLYAIIGVLLFGTSALVISQSTIVQTYALLTMFVTGAYYFAISSKWKLMAIMIGLGFAVHPLMAVILIIFLIFYKEYRNWKLILLTLSFCVFYAYIAFANKNPDLATQDGIIGSILNLIAVTNYFVGTTSIFELPKKILDVIGVIGISIGVIAIIPIAYYFLRTKYYKNILFWLIAIPILLFISDIDMQTFDYMLLSIPFLAIVASIGICKYFVVHGKRVMKYVYVGMAVIICFGVFNGYYFDLGNNLDPDMAVSRLYNDLDKITDDGVFISFNLSMVSLYNKEHSKNIYLVELEKLDRQEYLNQLQSDGIKLDYNKDKFEVARNIIVKNDNVWYAKLIDPTTYKYDVVFCDHNISLVDTYKIDNGVEWKFKPSNPYDIITTRIFLTEWQSAIVSKFNFRFLCVLLIPIIYGIRYFIIQYSRKKVFNY